MFYGIVTMNMLKLVIQDLQLGLHLLKCGTVDQHDLGPAVDIVIPVSSDIQ